MNIFIGATRQNDGKTIVSMGLVSAFFKRLNQVGYIKPVGQQFRLVDGEKIDKDAVLMNSIFSFPDVLRDMSPIAVPKGFTEEYIQNGDKTVLQKIVTDSYNKVAKDKKIVVVEGTGHAGVGSVFDLSNAAVAKLLDAPVVLVSCGGIGRPIDEIMLNKAMFDMLKVKVLGVIINKIRADKYDKIAPIVRKGLERQGLEVFGVIPYDQVLSSPTMRELLEDFGGQLLTGEKQLDNNITRIVVGAMPAHETLDYLGEGTLLITPGNREDIILAAISGCIPGISKTFSVSGMVLTCGYMPHKSVMQLLKEIPIPVLLVEDDTFAAASKLNNLIVKIRPGETGKIKTIEDIVEKHVNVDRILELTKAYKAEQS